jgi:hypothetical protein
VASAGGGMAGVRWGRCRYLYLRRGVTARNPAGFPPTIRSRRRITFQPEPGEANP